MTSQIEMIPLSQLAIAPENNRSRDAGKVRAVAESISVLGLIQPLSGYKQQDCVMIDAGGYRLEAFQLLANEKRLPKAYKAGLPVTVHDSSDMARARSIAENDVREAPHPVDRILAYKALFEDGRMTPAKIASACAVSTTDVNRLLRLKDVAPEILAACKAGEVPLDAVQAYSIHPDQAVQLQVFGSLQSWERHAHQIKQRLRSGTLPARSGLAKFVGREAYEAAGGRFAVDLFTLNDPEVDWLDADVAQRVADELLITVAEKVRAEGWAEVLISPEGAYWQALDQMPTSAPEVSGEVQDGYDEAGFMLEDEDGLSPLELAAAEWLIDYVDNLPAFTPEQRAEGVAVVRIGRNGPEIERGWKRPAAVEVAQEEAAEAPEATPEPEQEPVKVYDPVQVWGHAGHATLTRIGTASVRAALAGRPADAYDVLLAHMAVATLHRRAPGALTVQPVGMGTLTDGRLPTIEDALWLSFETWKGKVPDSFAEALTYVATLTAKTKADLLALCVALSLDAAEGGFHTYQRHPGKWGQLGVIARHVGHKVADHWTPDATLLETAPKGFLLQGLEACGVQSYSGAEKRPELAAALAREFAARRWIPKVLADLTPEPVAEPEPALMAAE